MAGWISPAAAQNGPLSNSANNELGFLDMHYVGTVIGSAQGRGPDSPSTTEPWLYDLQPSTMLDQSASDQNQRFKMWWFGHWDEGTDLPPFDHTEGDRIYYSTSPDGQTWTTPQVVLKAVAGTARDDNGNLRNAADDHTLGSPSVVKIGGKYYMFYECYGLWSTAVRRFYSVGRTDTWVDNGEVAAPQIRSRDYNDVLVPDWTGGYVLDPNENLLGFAPRFRRPGTHAVYSCELRTPDGRIDRYLRACEPNESRSTCNETKCEADGVEWRALHHGNPPFWFYSDSCEDAPPPDNGKPCDRKPIYAAFHPAAYNTFATAEPDGAFQDYVDFFSPRQRLGYVAESLTGADMLGSSDNRICLATWDGQGMEHGVPKWERFIGKAGDGAIVNPWNRKENHNIFPSPSYANVEERFDMFRSYGAGYPTALVRGEYLELFFQDDTAHGRPENRSVLTYRVRVRVGDIENPDAWVSASRQSRRDDVPGGLGDIVWSPVFGRYFAFANAGPPAPLLTWSTVEPNIPVLTDDQRRLTIPLAGRKFNQGSILSNEFGHALDFHRTAPAHTSLGLYISAHDPGTDYSNFLTNIDRVQAFVYSPMTPPQAGKYLLHGDRVSLQAMSGQWVSAPGDGSVNANASSAGASETWTLAMVEPGLLYDGRQVALQGPHGLYIRAQSGGGSSVDAGGRRAGPWELFTVKTLDGRPTVRDGSRIALQTRSGLWLMAYRGGGAELRATGRRPRIWETFVVRTHQ